MSMLIQASHSVRLNITEGNDVSLRNLPSLAAGFTLASCDC